MTDPVIGFISGTGPQGRGLGLRLAMAGLTVRIGSRQADRAKSVAEELNGMLAKAAAGREFQPIAGDENHAVVAGSAWVMLTVPFEHAATTLETYREDFRPGSVFVDVTVPLEFGRGDARVVVPPEGSGSLLLRRILPEGIPFTGAFKTLPAHVLEEIGTPLECDTFVFGDDKEAKDRLLEIIRRIPTLRPVDVGGLSAAATVEGMTALLIRINRRLKGKEGRFRVVGSS